MCQLFIKISVELNQSWIIKFYCTYNFIDSIKRFDMIYLLWKQRDENKFYQWNKSHVHILNHITTHFESFLKFLISFTIKTVVIIILYSLYWMVCTPCCDQFAKWIFCKFAKLTLHNILWIYSITLIISCICRDRLRTGCNVLSHNMICSMVEHICKKDLTHNESSEFQEIAQPSKCKA